MIKKFNLPKKNCAVCNKPFALKNVSPTVVAELSSLLAWSTSLINRSPVLKIPVGTSISPAISPLSFVCIFEAPEVRIPLEFAVMVLIVPFAPLVRPVTTFATANPTEEFEILLF